MQYSAAFCTPQVISKGSTCKIKIHLCMKFLLNPSFAMEMFDGSSFPIKFNLCDIQYSPVGFILLTLTGRFATTFLKGGIHRIGFVRSSSPGLL